MDSQMAGWILTKFCRYDPWVPIMFINQNLGKYQPWCEKEEFKILLKIGLKNYGSVAKTQFSPAESHSFKYELSQFVFIFSFFLPNFSFLCSFLFFLFSSPSLFFLFFPFLPIFFQNL